MIRNKRKFNKSIAKNGIQAKYEKMINEIVGDVYEITMKEYINNPNISKRIKEMLDDRLILFKDHNIKLNSYCNIIESLNAEEINEVLIDLLEEINEGYNKFQFVINEYLFDFKNVRDEIKNNNEIMELYNKISNIYEECLNVTNNISFYNKMVKKLDEDYVDFITMLADDLFTLYDYLEVEELNKSNKYYEKMDNILAIKIQEFKEYYDKNNEKKAFSDDYKELNNYLINIGYRPKSQKGSHLKFENDKGEVKIVPQHKIGKGLHSKIIKNK